MSLKMLYLEGERKKNVLINLEFKNGWLSVLNILAVLAYGKLWQTAHYQQHSWPKQTLSLR